MSVLLGVSIATLVFRIAEFILISLPKKNRFLRNFIYPISRVEGYWYEEVDVPSNPYSYACIEYDADEDIYNYYGMNYDSEFNLNSEFMSTSVEISKQLSTLYFRFQAQVQRRESPQLSGYGSLTFYRDGGRTFDRGHGYFVDVTAGSGGKERKLVLSRIPTKEIQRIKYEIGSKDGCDITTFDLAIKDIVKTISDKRKSQ